MDLLVSQILDGARCQGAETSKIYLNDLHVRPCQSCGIDPYPEYCLFKDDMEAVYSVMESCDVVVLGSPVYFDTVSAQTKLVIDRCNCLMPYVKRDDGSMGFERRLRKKKRGVFIAVAGNDQEFDTVMTTVKGFFNWANIELKETILYSHDDNDLGGVKKHAERMTQAFEVGAQIVRRGQS